MFNLNHNRFILNETMRLGIVLQIREHKQILTHIHIHTFVYRIVCICTFCGTIHRYVGALEVCPCHVRNSNMSNDEFSPTGYCCIIVMREVIKITNK